MTTSEKRLLVLAVTNPLIWLAAVLFLLVAVTAIVVLMLYVMVSYCRAEWSDPPRRTPPPVPVPLEPVPLPLTIEPYGWASLDLPAPPQNDDIPPLTPSPEMVAQLDEHNRIEVLVTELVDELPAVEQPKRRRGTRNKPPCPKVVPSASRTRKPPPAERKDPKPKAAKPKAKAARTGGAA